MEDLKRLGIENWKDIAYGRDRLGIIVAAKTFRE